VQEALTNCARHAQATDVLVSIAAQAGNVDVIVRDNGVGFDANYERGGLGLIGMRERVQALDGSLNIFSQAETGTIIRAQIPIGVTA
jgi:signal transduction histidine kinase